MTQRKTLPYTPITAVFTMTLLLTACGDTSGPKGQESSTPAASDFGSLAVPQGYKSVLKLGGELPQVGGGSETRKGSLQALALNAIPQVYECEPFLAPATRNQTWFLPDYNHYVTIDSFGRPLASEKRLPPVGQKKRLACQTTIGNLFGPVGSQPNLNGGHLLGTRFGGYGGRANVAPQNADFNQVLWNATEKLIFGCTVYGPRSVWVKPVVNYANNTTITPNKFGMYAVTKWRLGRISGTRSFEFSYDNAPGGGPDARTTFARLAFDTISVGCGARAIFAVMDDTGSMGDGLTAMKTALSEHIASIEDQREDGITDYFSLVSFKDDVTNYGITTDKQAMLSQVGSLYASGGGDCPENALGGISTALSNISRVEHLDKAPKDIVVVTDASAQAGDVSGIIQQANANNTRVNILLTGDCGRAAAARTGLSALDVSSQVALKQIAEETGGAYYYVPGAGLADYTRVLREIFEQIADDTPVDTEPPVVTVKATPAVLWPPNHKMIEVTPNIQATDNLDPSPVVKYVGIEVSEADDGQGDGNTQGDVKVSADGRIFVRAERSGQGNARRYLLTYSAEDASGNIGYGSTEIVVPKSMGQ